MNTFRKADGGKIAAQKDFAAVHAGTGEVADDRLAVIVQSQHDDHAAGLILTQKAAGPAADHHRRHLVAVRFHVDAGAVARVAFDKDRAAAHGIASRVADIPVHRDLALVPSAKPGQFAY